jgi:hypothetical protein
MEFRSMIKGTLMKKVLAWTILGLVGGWFLPALPAWAAEPPGIQQAAPPPAAEEKKEEAPTTCV